jgi:hypothetical protein
MSGADRRTFVKTAGLAGAMIGLSGISGETSGSWIQAGKMLNTKNGTATNWTGKC